MTTDPKPTPAQQLRTRIRRYFLTVFGLLGGAIALLGVIAVVAKAVAPDPRTAALTLALAGPLVMLGVVVSSWFAVAKYWRCPACEKSVFMTVSWNMSVFAGAASRNCPHCSVELFTLDGRRRGLRVILLVLGIAAGMGAAGAVLSASLGKRRPQPVAVPAPPP